MIDSHKEWLDTTVAVSELNLDLLNPRIPQHIKDQGNPEQIRNYLLEKEDVIKIARSIAKNGYHRSAVSIVYKENGEFVVLDGNRRLVACQILLNPELVSQTRDRKELEQLRKEFDPPKINKVKISIAPSRKEAEKEIWDIHVNELLRPWEVLQKLRMYRSLIDVGDYDIQTASKEYGISTSKFKKELGKLFFYEKILERITDKEEEELLNSGFNAIDRLILSDNGKKLLDYTIDDSGNILFKNRRVAENKIKLLIPYIVGDLRIAAQSSQNDLIKGVFSKIDPVKFPLKKGIQKAVISKPQEQVTATVKSVFPQALLLRRRRNSVKYPLDEAVDIIEHILYHINSVAEQLLDRYDKRETLRIGDEYDVQDLLHSLLAMFFDDVVNEEWLPSLGANPSRGDFLLLDNGTIIEVKTTLKKTGVDKAIRVSLERDLNDDLMKYSRWPGCKRIFLFVYDPEKKIKKYSQFERGMDANKIVGIKVRTIINRA